MRQDSKTAFYSKEGSCPCILEDITLPIISTQLCREAETRDILRYLAFLIASQDGAFGWLDARASRILQGQCFSLQQIIAETCVETVHTICGEGDHLLTLSSQTGEVRGEQFLLIWSGQHISSSQLRAGLPRWEYMPPRWLLLLI